MEGLDMEVLDENAILKEVWGVKDIEVKTDLSSEQIKHVNRALTYAYVFDDPVALSHATMFMKLQKSKDRKSMEEFIKGLASKVDELSTRLKAGFGGGMLG